MQAAAGVLARIDSLQRALDPAAHAARLAGWPAPARKLATV